MSAESLGFFCGVITFLVLLGGIVFRFGYTKARVDDQEKIASRTAKLESDFKELKISIAREEGRELGRREASSHDLDKYRRE